MRCIVLCVDSISVLYMLPGTLHHHHHHQCIRQSTGYHFINASQQTALTLFDIGITTPVSFNGVNSLRKLLLTLFMLSESYMHCQLQISDYKAEHRKWVQDGDDILMVWDIANPITKQAIYKPLLLAQ